MTNPQGLINVLFILYRNHMLPICYPTTHAQHRKKKRFTFSTNPLLRILPHSPQPSHLSTHFSHHPPLSRSEYKCVPNNRSSVTVRCESIFISIYLYTPITSPFARSLYRYVHVLYIYIYVRWPRTSYLNFRSCSRVGLLLRRSFLARGCSSFLRRCGGRPRSAILCSIERGERERRLEVLRLK